MPTWTEEDMKKVAVADSLPEPGEYAVEVKYAIDKGTNKNNDPYWSIRLDEVGTDRTIVFDNLTFGSNPGIAYKKMSILGLNKTESGAYTISSPNELLGLRCLVTIKGGEYKGKPQSKVDTVPGTFFGYAPLESNEVEAVADEEDVPF